MSHFKNARICLLHFSADGERTSTALPSINIPEFKRQEAVAALLQLTTSHMESNQRKVYEDTGNITKDPITEPQSTAYSDTSTEDTGNITKDPITEPQSTAYSHTSTEDTGNITKDPITEPQTTAYSDNSIKDTANRLNTAEDIISVTKPQTTAYSDNSIKDTANRLNDAKDIIPVT
ncbi:hypothetical protein ACJMK2_037592 [Sinanodonta woodiana]|uniref:Uncharacterized protein n=1 Tax=Sinanodonta woodiana TaxID=1069815 RepID=A0ABD3WKY1_SINWO